jgi:RNA polymerase sigma factor (sigma-70 family)
MVLCSFREAKLMSNPGDHGSEDAGEPPAKRCSFCLKSSKVVGILIEGPERGELGAAYICQECVELCAMILVKQKQRAADTCSQAAGSPVDAPTGELLKERIDKVLNTLTDREREILKMRYGLGDDYPHTHEEFAQRFKMTREHVREIDAQVVKKLQSPDEPSEEPVKDDS